MYCGGVARGTLCIAMYPAAALKHKDTDAPGARARLRIALPGYHRQPYSHGEAI
jgi:hypothetical protein